MVTLTDRITTVEILCAQIAQHGKLPDDMLRRIEYRFRLECNYYSNRIEGGTLTRQETRSVMVNNIEVDKKPFREIAEMKGHDQAMKEIYQIGLGELKISEKRIKGIHKLIMSSNGPDEKEMIGIWKEEPNHIYNTRDEKYYFVPPNEVPERMHQLLNWLNAEIDKLKQKSVNPIFSALLSFEFHHKFLTIHPFDDGNGRTARLLSNLILISNGFPPFYITDDEKEVYNRYLTDIQGYGGDPNLFYEFLMGLLERSLKLTLDVIEGRDQDENGEEWIKQLRLLKTELPIESSLKVAKNEDVMDEIANKSLLPVIENLMNKLMEFDDLFVQKEMWIGEGANVGVTSFQHVIDVAKTNRMWMRNSLSFKYELKGFVKSASTPFNVRMGIKWQLNDYNYSIQFLGLDENPQYTKLYHQFYSNAEVVEITSKCATYLLSQIQKKLQQ
jgi:Fic family protein